MSEAVLPTTTSAQAPDVRRRLLASLSTIVGAQHLLTESRSMRRYCIGFRFGRGKALAVVRPGSLVEQWKVLQECVAAGVAIIAQASNTGLTGGSTPYGEDYDRDIVIISTSRIKTVHVIEDGRQVVCLPGSTLDQLERLLKPMGREPHSVIGSSCIGASVIGGVCNNSGGSLVNRGPAYTEMALYGAVDADGRLHLVNHLGIELGADPETILAKLESRGFSDQDVLHDVGAASDHGYAKHVRDIDAPTPARYNADPLRLREASGSAGKVMVFAVRLDTFPAAQGAKVFYIGTNDTHVLTDIRRYVLGECEHLPIAGEYLHRDAFDVAARYGKDLFWIIEHFGTDRLPAFFSLKNRCDAFFERLGFLPANLSDRLMQFSSRLLPKHLPDRLLAYRDEYEHHLMLKIPAEGVTQVQAFLAEYFAQGRGGYFECTEEEGKKAFLHRFAAASAAVRYRAVHGSTVEDIVALDIALRRDDRDWFERLPSKFDDAIEMKLYYGHFLCHVFHQDYVIRKGHDCMAIEHQMLELLDARGAEYPAEHNVGHLYQAKPPLQAFYKKLDPCNCFNPGIGFMSKYVGYAEQDEAATSGTGVS